MVMMAVHEYLVRSEWRDVLQRCRESRRLVLVIVAIALLLDNMLLTTVVPIIPEFLYNIRHRNVSDGIDVSEVTKSPVDRVLILKGTESLLTDRIKSRSTVAPTSSKKVSHWSLYLIGLQRENSDSGDEFDMKVAKIDPESVINCSILTQESTYKRKMDKRDSPSSTRSPEDELRHRELASENVEVGLMFASKAIVQLIANPFVGPLTNRIGYSIPMFAGFVIMFLSTIIFAFGRSYTVLFVARSLQGIGSSCSSVSGMGMLAERYPDDQERGNAMGLALGGLALGVLIGPPFGGVMYQFVGKTAPFLILACLALGDGLLQLLVLQPGVKKQDQEGPSLLTLLKDPYIVIALGALTFANLGIAMLEPSLPIYMMDNMHSEKWELGAAFLPASISYLIGTNLFGPLGHRMGRWLASLIGLLIIGVCLIRIPSSTQFNDLIVPNAGLGFAIGMVDSSMMPQLGYLVDLRHAAVYGSVYAIGDVAFCLGFATGPALSGTLVKNIGFSGMLYGSALINFIYAPFLYFLRNPPGKGEKHSLIMNDTCPVRYVTCVEEGQADDEER